jgi:hypothetical protein
MGDLQDLSVLGEHDPPAQPEDGDRDAGAEAELQGRAARQIGRPVDRVIFRGCHPFLPFVLPKGPSAPPGGRRSVAATFAPCCKYVNSKSIPDLPYQ